MKTLARTLGVTGLLLIAWSLTIWVFFANVPWAIAHLVAGVAASLFFFVRNVRSMGAFATSRGTFFLFISGFGALFLLVLVGFGNYAAIKKGGIWDVTKAKIHTLAPDTVSTLKALKSDLEVLAFFSAGEPNMEGAKDLLGRYAKESDKVKVEWIDPVRDPVRVKKYAIRRDGGHRIVVLFRAPGRPPDAVPTEQRVQEITEEALTNAVVKVTRGSEKTIYFVTGHGESDVDDTQGSGLSEAKKRMENEGIMAAKLNLASTEDVPADAGAVVVAGPRVDFAQPEADSLKRYVDEGGRLMVLVEPQTAVPVLVGMLKQFAIEPEEAIVVDPLSRLFGAGVLAPVVQEYADHDITREFRLNTVFPTARPLTILRDVMTVQTKPLALVLQTAWAETNAAVQPFKRDETEKGGPFPIAATATKDTRSAEKKRADEARLVAVGDRDFATNQYRLVAGNEDFFLNCLNWMVEQTERITIRPRMREASRLFLTEAQRAGIFLGAGEAPVVILIAGLWVWLARRSR